MIPHYDLTHVIDTSGAYIPGHGTPTVILVTRHRAPTGADVRCVMSRRGEPETPKDHVGRMWNSILAGLGMPPFDAPAGATPVGLVWASALAKLVKALAAEIATDAKLSRKDAAPIAAAWVTTAGALRLVDRIAGMMRDRASDDAEHLGRSFERVAELLILRCDMPRSLHASLREVVDNLAQVSNGHSADTERRAGRLLADLQYGRIDEILATGLHAFLTQFLDRVNDLGAGVSRDFLVPVWS